MLDLTAQERKVLVTLGALALLGLAVIAYRTYIDRPDIRVVPGPRAAEGFKDAMGPAGPVNINTADAEKIESLPDIGPKMAKDIVDYRAAHGQYLFKEDLMKVRGIGPKTFGKIKELIALE
ncbi:MAG: helix-hairpin-helix domain-containing protein [Candidatus Omnitrophota bacterium]